MYSRQQELLEMVLAGDKKAEAELVVMYQPLARRTASYFFSISGGDPCVTYEDLLSEANYGFVSALKTYDPAKGHAFSSYVENGMKIAIRKFLSVSSRPIRLPKYQIERMSKLDKFLSQEGYRAMDVAEIAGGTGLSEKAVHELLEIRRTHRCLSLDQAADGDDPDSSLGQLLGDDGFVEDYERTSLISDIGSFLSAENGRDCYILKALTGCFGQEKRSLLQLSSELGISVSAVRKSYCSMLSKMKMQFSVA